MFWEIYSDLCYSFKKSPTTVGKEIGVTATAVSCWKNKNTMPHAQTLEKIAEYFGVNVEYLKGETTDGTPTVQKEQKNNPAPEMDAGLADFIKVFNLLSADNQNSIKSHALDLLKEQMLQA